MRKMIELKRVLALIICFSILFTIEPVSILALKNYNVQAYESEEVKFDKYLLDLFKEGVSSDSISLNLTVKDKSKYGIEDIKPTLGNFKEMMTSNSSEEYKELKKFSYKNLNKDQQLTYRILEYEFKLEEKFKGLEYYRETLSPVIGFQAQLPLILVEYKFRNKKDIEDYIELIKSTEDYFKEIVEFEKEKANRGLFMADFAVDDIISQINGFIENSSENFMITSFPSRLEELSFLTDEEKAVFINKNKELINNSFIPTYKYLADELNKLKGSGENEGGLGSFEKGKDYYEYLVASETGTGKSIEELKAILKNRLDKEIAEFEEIVDRNPDIYNKLENVEYESSDPKEILDILEERIKEYYPEIPKVNYEIKYIDKSLEDHVSPAMYFTPPVDDYMNNVIYINNKQIDNSGLFNTMAHEGYPGHLYQSVYFYNTNPHEIRSILDYNGYSEGWGTYVEDQAYELANLNDKDLVRAIQINNDIYSLVTSLVDIGVNYDNWSLAEVKNFINEHYGEDTDSMAEDIFKYVVETPGNYVSYYVGYLEFTELKEYSMKELGDKFVLKDFNKAVLDVGPAPFPIVKEEVDKYIQAKKSENIDKEKPVVSIDSVGYEEGIYTNKDVTLSMSNLTNNTGTTKYEYKLKNEDEWKTYTNPLVISESGNYEYQFRIISEAGIISDEISFKVNIDKEVPTIDISGDLESKVDKLTLNVTATAGISGKTVTVKNDNGEETVLTSDKYEVSKNGKYIFTVTNGVGEKVSKEVNVANIVTDGDNNTAGPETTEDNNLIIPLLFIFISSIGVMELTRRKKYKVK